MSVWAPACALALHVTACAESSARDDSEHGSAGLGGGGSQAGAQGGSTTPGGSSGRSASGGSGGAQGGQGGSAAGRAGSQTAGDAGTSGGSSSGGDAGQSNQGGAAGSMEASAGEGGVGAASGSGGSGPGTNCRLYASEFTYSSSGVYKTLSCAFDRPSLTMTCTSDAGDVTATTWATIEDAVGENRPLGAMRAQQAREVIAFTTSECRLTRDFVYDGAHHLTTIAITIDPDYPCSTNEAVYDAWDDAGRVTHGVEHGIGEETCVGGDVAFTYDDTLHSITTTRSGGTDCLEYTTVLRYDADGLKLNAGVNPDMPTSTFETLATAELCE